ncbi:MAG: heme-binding domain-containing protein [Bacteroidota bacterium]
MKRSYLIISLVLFVALLWQIPRPELSNPPVVSKHDLLYRHPAPNSTAQLLRAACYDCHSHQTIWPCYAQLNPLSDFIEGHVRHGRSELNFSQWQEISAEDIDEVGEACAKLIKNHSMPMASYLWLHPEARLSPAQRAELVDYFLTLKAYPDEN